MSSGDGLEMHPAIMLAAIAINQRKKYILPDIHVFTNTINYIFTIDKIFTAFV